MYFYKVIPDMNFNNLTVADLAKDLHDYIPIQQRMKMTKEGLNVDFNQISWEIYITKDNIGFYFGTNKEECLNILKKHLPKATINQENNVLDLNPSKLKVKELEYKYHQFMSLKTSLNTLEPISSIIDTQKMLDEDDYALVQYIFTPESLDWHESCTEAYKKFKDGKTPRQIRLDKKEIGNKIAKFGAK